MNLLDFIGFFDNGVTIVAKFVGTNTVYLPREFLKINHSKKCIIGGYGIGDMSKYDVIDYQLVYNERSFGKVSRGYFTVYCTIQNVKK